MNATTSPDGRVFDPYLQHLSAVHLKRGVYAVEDICTHDGLVVVRTGQSLPARIDDFLQRHALRKPLQLSVQVDAALSAARIRDDVIGTIPAKQMQTLYGRYDLVTDLERGIEIVARFPLLTQQLTTLALELPHIYQQTLIVTWLGLAIGIKMKMGRTERSQLIAGSLCHMLGMLHVNVDVARRTDKLSVEQQGEIQAYVERGAAALNGIPNLPTEILAMVAQHRELPDGTGYPKGLEGNDLCAAGQIIGVAQSAYSIYTKTLRPQGRSPRDLFPIIQINSAVYRRDICSALLQLLREQNLPEISLVNDDNVEGVVARLLEDARAIESCRHGVAAIVRRLQDESPRPEVARAQKIYQHLESILSSSGVLDPAHADWMKQVVRLRYQQFYREIEDLDLMLGEVRWQIRRLGQLLRDFTLEGGPLSATDKSELDGALEGIRRSR